MKEHRQASWLMSGARKLPIRTARKGRVRPSLPAPIAVAAHIWALRVAFRQAHPNVADLPGAAGGETLPAPLEALHPGLPWVRRLREHPALAALRARRLLAVRAIHVRAYRGSFIEADAILAFGTPPPLAGRQAHGFGVGVGAEKTLGALRRLSAWAARPAAPTVVMAATHQPGGAGVPLVSRCGIAALSFLPHAQGNADAYSQPILFRGKRAADVVFRALRIRHALAVGAVRQSVSGLVQAAQRRFTLGTRAALSSICHQPHALLWVEHGAEVHPPWCLHWYFWPQQPPQQEHEW
jgi:hypothetical protein